ncbi:hypothetical protein JTB14_006525 [Gonioctena quinquepunctata]|nr:hypothetical protein JTB14_006525 [Gonioctena quinquepunctata]
MNQFKIGPVGLLLRNNLKTEWFYNIVINKDITVVLNESDVSETYDYAKELCSQTLPFGIAEIQPFKNVYKSDEIIEYYKNAMNNKNVEFEDLLRHEGNSHLRCTVFVSPSSSTPFFHQWQRQRKMWWRKFSASPGRYSLTVIKNGENNSQYVEIMVKYPWGSQLLETVTLNTIDRKFTNPQLEFKENKKHVHAHIIVSQVNLSTMFMNAICDAYDESVFQDKPRELLRLHKKLAPYKISFAITATNQSSVAELGDLALYLCKQLRTNHVSTLLLLISTKLTLDAQYKQYDQLGIPYNVVLNENTLKNGVANLRSRETTLKEQVHVTELVAYVDQLLKHT